VADAWHDAYGGSWAEPDPAAPAIAENWIKAWPCCLQTHGAIECASELDAIPDGPLTVVAHPVSRQAAGYDAVETPLQAKFSIPYTTAYTLLHGPPDVRAFAALDSRAQALSERIAVRTDRDLRESEFLLLSGHDLLAHTTAARGSPERPLDADALAAKVQDLAPGLDGALADGRRPAAELLSPR
jgi:2-methylcitrate dehydratase PrpD